MRPDGTSDPGAGYRDRLARLRRGTTGELIAALLLMAKGYRILARRHRTPFGEIDIIAVRRRRIAFIEVKRRPTLDEAHDALRDEQTNRITAAAEYWISRHPRYEEHDMGLDAILIVPGRWPEHLPDALSGW